MKGIKTKNNHTFVIDDEDYDLISQYNWTFYDRYVEASINNKTVKLSRFLLQSPPEFHVDHINGDRLDNRRENLRHCTRSQNQQNRKLNKNSTTGHKGIQKIASGHYRVRVQTDGVREDVGVFVELSEAVKAREKFAKERHGEFYRKE